MPGMNDSIYAHKSDADSADSNTGRSNNGRNRGGGNNNQVNRSDGGGATRSTAGPGNAAQATPSGQNTGSGGDGYTFTSAEDSSRQQQERQRGGGRGRGNQSENRAGDDSNAPAHPPSRSSTPSAPQGGPPQALNRSDSPQPETTPPANTIRRPSNIPMASAPGVVREPVGVAEAILAPLRADNILQMAFECYNKCLRFNRARMDEAHRGPSTPEVQAIVRIFQYEDGLIPVTELNGLGPAAQAVHDAVIPPVSTVPGPRGRQSNGLLVRQPQNVPALVLEPLIDSRIIKTASVVYNNFLRSNPDLGALAHHGILNVQVREIVRIFQYEDGLIPIAALNNLGPAAEEVFKAVARQTGNIVLFEPPRGRVTGNFIIRRPRGVPERWLQPLQQLIQGASGVYNNYVETNPKLGQYAHGGLPNPDTIDIIRVYQYEDGLIPVETLLESGEVSRAVYDAAMAELVTPSNQTPAGNVGTFDESNIDPQLRSMGATAVDSTSDSLMQDIRTQDSPETQQPTTRVRAGELEDMHGRSVLQPGDSEPQDESDSEMGISSADQEMVDNFRKDMTSKEKELFSRIVDDFCEQETAETWETYATEDLPGGAQVRFLEYIDSAIIARREIKPLRKRSRPALASAAQPSGFVTQDTSITAQSKGVNPFLPKSRGDVPVQVYSAQQEGGLSPKDATAVQGRNSIPSSGETVDTTMLEPSAGGMTAEAPSSGTQPASGGGPRRPIISFDFGGASERLRTGSGPATSQTPSPFQPTQGSVPPRTPAQGANNATRRPQSVGSIVPHVDNPFRGDNPVRVSFLRPAVERSSTRPQQVPDGEATRSGDFQRKKSEMEAKIKDLEARLAASAAPQGKPSIDDLTKALADCRKHGRDLTEQRDAESNKVKNLNANMTAMVARIRALEAKPNANPRLCRDPEHQIQLFYVGESKTFYLSTSGPQHPSHTPMMFPHLVDAYNGLSTMLQQSEQAALDATAAIARANFRTVQAEGNDPGVLVRSDLLGDYDILQEDEMGVVPDEHTQVEWVDLVDIVNDLQEYKKKKEREQPARRLKNAGTATDPTPDPTPSTGCFVAEHESLQRQRDQAVSELFDLRASIPSIPKIMLESETGRCALVPSDYTGEGREATFSEVVERNNANVQRILDGAARTAMKLCDVEEHRWYFDEVVATRAKVVSEQNNLNDETAAHAATKEELGSANRELLSVRDHLKITMQAEEDIVARLRDGHCGYEPHANLINELQTANDSKNIIALQLENTEISRRGTADQLKETSDELITVKDELKVARESIQTASPPAPQRSEEQVAKDLDNTRRELAEVKEELRKVSDKRAMDPADCYDPNHKYLQDKVSQLTVAYDELKKELQDQEQEMEASAPQAQDTGIDPTGCTIPDYCAVAAHVDLKETREKVKADYESLYDYTYTLQQHGMALANHIELKLRA